MWPIIVTRSDHVTIWQSFWQNGDFDWLAVLKTILWLAVLFVLITSEFLRNIRLRNHAKSKFLATSVKKTVQVLKRWRTKMCLRTGSFILSNDVFWVHEIYKVRKCGKFPTCFCGLVDRILGWHAKGPRFKTHLRLTLK